MRPKNEISERLLASLALKNIEATSGYFCGQTYCVGVVVANPAQAVELGMQLGPNFGNIGWDEMGNKLIIVFRDALVSA
ncbi:hypothetical protein RYA05_03330 [Pseudomonas syringae pv. actinidiae]|nr:hypothetical protein [Pseudomonas syringae pv. actinidiae]